MNYKLSYFFKLVLLPLLLSLSFASCDFAEFEANLMAFGLTEETLEVELHQQNFENKDLAFKKENISLASWNIRHLGRTKTPEDIYEIATILKDFDIVAIQEVVAKDPAGAQAVAKIADELNRMGYKWDYQVSDPTKSPSANMSERYAFLWKTSRVSIVHRAYLDEELEDLCYREPFVAKFKPKGKTEPFYVVNYHS